MFLSFSKYQAAGNDFIIIDDRAGSFPAEKDQFIHNLCHRRFGIGADGLLLLQKSSIANFRIRIFNADGKEVAMCGNGMRCFVHYLGSLGFRGDPFVVETMHDTVYCHIKGDKISVKLDNPSVLYWGVELEADNQSLEAFVVHTGVPHAVIFVDDLDHVDVEGLGRKVRNHSLFAPHGVNVNFAKMGSDGSVHVRTYERGVEGETYSCGTGAAAVALTVSQKDNLLGSIRIIPFSKQFL
ncbi:MAG: diaminopimelate epimerase, partial [Chlamydiae bacterium]|nr:diaminopimelate epimerase [Chlamydiota bacterium]